MSNADYLSSHSYSSVSHRQIAALVGDFARFTDCRQWSELTQMLMPFISLSNPTAPPEVVLSAQQFTERWRTWQEPLGPTQHSLTIRHSAVFGTEATGRHSVCFVDAVITNSPNLETVSQWGGQFYFVFIQQRGIWRIGKLEIVPLWITEPPGTSALLTHLERFFFTNTVHIGFGGSQDTP